MSQAVVAELLRPIGFRGTTNKRQTFVCTATSAIHVEFIEPYSTDSFLMALGQFKRVRGTPLQIQSDRGDQLVAAFRQTENWGFEEV